MSRIPTGFIHVKDYYSDNVTNISPCTSTELYRIRKPGVKIQSNLPINTAHLILDYFERYRDDGHLIEEEWQRLEIDKKEQGFIFNKDGYCLNICYLCDYNPALQIYVLQARPQHDLSNFWSYIWSQKTTKFVYLQHRHREVASYWPDEGSTLCGDYEISTVSVHVCSQWYVTRNFFIKYLPTNETETVTQFHFTGWPTCREWYQKNRLVFIQNLLQFRREFRASFAERNSPVLVQSEDGMDLSGSFVLLDSILVRLLNGVREIDIEACLEYFRDQCPELIQNLLNYEIVFHAISSEILQICESDGV